MKRMECHENYPMWIVIVSNLVTFITYFSGAVIIYYLGPIWLALYLLFIGWLELRLMSTHCVNCYYYGKYCAFGKGKLSSLLFKKGDPKKFNNIKITWKDLIPDFMVSIIPVIVGIALLIVDFSWLLLILVILILMLSFMGSSFVRGSLACKFCKQREIGCPAEKLFSKTK